MQASNSFSAPTKFVPLSDQIVLGVPRRAMNRSMPMTQELVSRDGTNSRCTALVVRQVKRNRHLFSRWTLRASEEIPRVPVSAGLSPLRTWCHSSTVVDSRISPTRLAANTSNFSVEFIYLSFVRTRDSRTQKSNSTENVLRAITEHVELNLINRLCEVTTGNSQLP